MATVPEYFGSLVFDDRVMKANLPAKVYASLRKTIDEGKTLDLSVANAVASAMKDWAVANGATHFTHWFQPLTGVTAEKHDSFIAPSPDGGVIMEFSGKELIRGEPDASSFPSGGLRATFEARGYTAWDPTSYAFIKEKSLCIPTAFCSYGGEALDKKAPLLRSMEALNKQALRILRLFGNTKAKYVHTSVGPEQEYFLVDAKMYAQRRDLRFTGRTLFGAKPPKGQELDDHYYGAIKPRVAAFMHELDVELWKLGVFSKTEHNEVAPAQHENAPVYCNANIACDHNQLTMELLKTVAERHGLVCLLHEKPFAGVNGSGKHDNWSLQTDTGENLLKPGKTPSQNAQFLLFLAAFIKGADEYQDMLRCCVAYPGNDRRLGGNEAPPAIVSVFLGDELTAILDSIIQGTEYVDVTKRRLEVGVDTLPEIPQDTTDRNRTSPLAFTGNKFEFRMLGSSNSIACTNIMLNAAVAESLKQYADVLEKADDFESTLHDLIQKTIKAHKRIIFNGNGYDDAWIKEATEERGLLNLKTTPDALPCILEQKNVDMLTSLKVMSEAEIRSRCEIMLDNYRKTVNIEAQTMVDMARKEILPAVEDYTAKLAEGLAAKKAVVPTLSGKYETGLIEKLSGLADQIDTAAGELEAALDGYHKIDDVTEAACAIRDTVIPKMAALRAPCDEAETCTASQYWPFPTYSDLLFGVK